jgi:hypothetical protein
MAVAAAAVALGAGGAMKAVAQAVEASGGDKDTFLDKLYAYRATQYSSSTPEVRAAMMRRLDRERAELREVSAESAKSVDAVLTPEMKKEVLTDAERGVADDDALKYMERIKAGGQGNDYETIEQEILAKPPYIRPALNALFKQHYGAYKVEQDRIVVDSVIAARETMKEMSMQPDGPAQMYLYAHDLPAGNPTERKIKDRVLADYAEYSRFFGKNKLTDPGKYTAVFNAIQYGEIQDEKALSAHPDAVSVADTDMEHLKAFLKKTSVVDPKDIETSFRYMVGDGKGPFLGSLTKQNDKHNAEFVEYTNWLLDAAKKSKRGAEPGYAMEMAKLWRQSGETKARWGFGYGRDTTYGDAAYDAGFLPDLSGDNLKAVQAVFSANPETAKRWMAAVGGDYGYAMRAYWKELQERDLLKPRGRPEQRGEN